MDDREEQVTLIAGWFALHAVLIVPVVVVTVAVGETHLADGAVRDARVGGDPAAADNPGTPRRFGKRARTTEEGRTAAG